MRADHIFVLALIVALACLLLVPLVAAARRLNPSLRILVQALYLRERPDLEQAGANAARFEEVEAAVDLAGTLRREVGTDDRPIQRETGAIRRELMNLS